MPETTSTAVVAPADEVVIHRPSGVSDDAWRGLVDRMTAKWDELCADNEPATCTVSWCLGRNDPRVCGGTDHQADVETITCSGDLTHPDDLRVCAGTIGIYQQDVVSLLSRDDRWTTELRPFEARRLSEALLRHAQLIEAEPGVKAKGVGSTDTPAQAGAR